MSTEFLARAGRPVWGGALTLERIREAVPERRVVICAFDGGRLVRIGARDAHRIRATELDNYFVFPAAVPPGELPVWATHEEALRSLNPIYELPVPSIESGARDLELNGREFEALIGTGVLDDLECLRLCRSMPRPEQLARLTSLRSLSLFGSSDDESFVLQTASLSALPALESCELNFLRIDDEGAMALAENRALSQLTDLDLECNEIGDRGVLAIARSSVLKNLKRLSLSWNPFHEVSPLAVAGHLPALEELRLIDVAGRAGSEEALELRFGDGLSYYRIGGG
jgi:hypothetical protein